MGAKILQSAKECVNLITGKCAGLLGMAGDQQNKTEKPISSIVTGFRWKSIIGYWLNKAGFARFANNLPAVQTQERTGTISSASITAAIPKASEACCATTAISLLDTLRHERQHLLSPSISSFTIDRIASIEPAGVDDVFDVEIDRTENFISNGLISHNTRWHPLDLAGRLLDDEKEGGQKWHVLSVPMECDSSDDPLERKLGERLWPEWFTAAMVEQAKRDARSWAALYQQKPTVDGGNILRMKWWKPWDGKTPVFSYVLQSWDVAFSDQDLKTNSYSARTTWGVFLDAKERPAVLMIEAWRDRVDYPSLKKEALRAYQEHRPDCVLIEKKVNGHSLIQDLRRHGLPLAEYQPDRDKISRAYAVQAMLEGGQIYYPPRRWADDVIADLAQFPNGQSDDWTDTATQAWLRLRNGGLLAAPYPEPAPDADDELPARKRPAIGVYG
jgi:predicted phage terminase large subunit-like protein